MEQTNNVINFPLLSVTSPSELMEQFRIQETAYHEGESDAPNTEQTTPSAKEAEIVSYFEKQLIDAKELVEKYELDQTNLRNSIDIQATYSEIENVPYECQQQMTKERTNNNTLLNSLAQEENEATRDYKKFKMDNKLQRDAKYPESHIWHYALVIFIIFAESVLNSYFFSKGSDLGLLGGLFQALIISVVNVFVSILAGIIAFRNCHHISFSRRLMGWLGVVLWIAIIITFNLLVAHYRAALEVDPFTAMVDAITNMRNDVFGINNVDSWILFIVGVLAAVAAAFKGYLGDDRYPGYGEVDRKYRTARKNFENAKTETYEKLSDIHKEHLDDISRLVKEAQDQKSLYQQSLEKSKKAFTSLKHYKQQLDSTCNELINNYREANTQMRNTPAPAYFAERFSFSEALKLDEPDFSLAESRIDEIAENIKELHNAATKARNDVKQTDTEQILAFEKLLLKVGQKS